MPNHFHMLAYVSEEKNQLNSQLIKSELKSKHRLSIGIASLLSSYAQAINNQNGSTGSLFQQKTKAKCLNAGDNNYASTCFHYIHQNPCKAGLVKQLENWEYASFKDYAGLRNGSLCNKKLAYQLLDLRPDSFYEDSYKMIDHDKARFIF